MRLIDKCWKSVTKQTVVNCFKSCGFAIDRDQDVPNFDDFANVDEGVSVYGSLSDQDIIATVTSEDVLSDDDNDGGMEQPPDITTKEAKAADRPWVCGVCGTGHARKEHLERHQVTHSDLRPYACPACPKTFKRNEHLSRHLVIHSGQKSELCRECGKTFYRKDHLRKHAESHHNKRGKHTLPAMPPAMPPGAAVMPPGAAVMALS
ncbi:hypothetical protein J6590_009636 [Homalodisca vitripennis]|nr:hypothetical protein J6590_009636 [Homalodisca vitripennis]